MSRQKCIRKDEIKIITGLSYSTINRLEKEGLFPLRRKIGKRAVAWLETEVMHWIDSRNVPDLQLSHGV